MVTVRASLTVVLALLVLTALSSVVEAYDAASALQKGSQALQFGVGYDFKLSPFQGATISYERFVRDRLALRVGAGISMDYSKGPYVEEFRDGGIGSGEVDVALWRHAYSISCHLVSYRAGQVALFYGGGPKVTYSNYLDQRYSFYPSSSGGDIYSSRRRYWDRSWGVGLEGVAGVQWVLNDRFRLLAQYATAVMYGRSFRERLEEYERQTYGSSRETDDRYFVQVTPQAVQAGLSVSF